MRQNKLVFGSLLCSTLQELSAGTGPAPNNSDLMHLSGSVPDRQLKKSEKSASLVHGTQQHIQSVRRFSFTNLSTIVAPGESAASLRYAKPHAQRGCVYTQGIRKFPEFSWGCTGKSSGAHNIGPL